MAKIVNIKLTTRCPDLRDASALVLGRAGVVDVETFFKEPVVAGRVPVEVRVGAGVDFMKQFRS
jgi:hypothetical protein